MKEEQIFIKKEPLLSDYNLTENLFSRYKLQVLDHNYLIEKKYLLKFSIFITIVFWIYKGGFSYLFEKGFDGFIVACYTIPLSIAVTYILLILIVGILSKLLILLHPLTKQVQNYEEDLNTYKKELEDFKENQLRLQTEFWYGLTGHQFEYEVADLFKRFGYKVEVTKGSDDKGVDINMWLNGKYIVVQCKAHKKKLSPAISRELYGTMTAHHAKEAYLITLEGVSKKSLEFIIDKPIKVFDVNSLISMQNKLIEK